LSKALSVSYISHALLAKNGIENRIYQQKILHNTIYNNTIIVLPAGMGKTIIATLLIAYYLNRHTKKSGKITTKCIFLTSTKPLVIKRTAILKEKLTIPEHINFIIGTIPNEKRTKLFQKATILIMTPHVLYNDLINGLYDLRNVSLIVFDECHRATGDHVYVKVANVYFLQKSDGKILGLATSLGNKRTVREVCDNLKITAVEGRTVQDDDISSYHSPKKQEWRMVPLPKLFQDMRTILEKQLYKFIEGLAKKNVQVPDDPRRVTIKQLVELQSKYQDKLSTVPLRTKLSTILKLTTAQISSCIRLLQLIERIETQGLSSARNFIDKIQNRALQNKKGLMLRRFCSLKSIKTVQKMLEEGLNEGYEHPKVIETIEIIKKQISEKSDSKILIFANYRASVNIIVDELNKVNDMAETNVSAAGLIGHKHKGAIGGLSSKQQMTLLKRFEEGIVNVIVATSVAEQGLDITECDLVLFYDCVPDQIRAHQRRNRTGKQNQGRVIVLITKGTIDERYYWVVKEADRKLN